MFDILRQKNGSTLLVVMALMALLTMVAIMSADRATLDIDLSYNQLHSEKAFYAADAGIKHAVTVLNDSADWRTGFLKKEFSGAHYTVAVIDSLTQPGLLDTIILKSTAVDFGAVGNVEAKVVPKYDKPFQYAAYGKDSTIMKNTACTDSFNSDSGSYAATQLNEYGNVGSNGNIRMANTADVYGDASTSGGTISLDGSAVVYGDTSSSAPEVDMNMTPQSEFDWAESNNNAPFGFSGDFDYNSTTYALNLNNMYDTVTLSSGVYYFSTFSLRNQSALLLAPGAEVTIYMTGNLDLEQGSSINPGGTAADLIIYSQGTELNINNGTEFQAGFWGPDTYISIEQNTDVYGSIVGGVVSIANSACVHFDRKLLKYSKLILKEMAIVAWREM